MTRCANHKGPRRGMPALPTTAVLGYLLTVTSLFILPYFIFLVSPVSSTPSLSTTLTALETRAPYRFYTLLLSAVITAKRFVTEAQLRKWALGQSLVGPGWMNELSGSQPGDERPRLHAGSDGGDISSRQPHSKRGIHVRTTPRMDVTVGGAIAWGSSVALSGEYRHLCLSHRIF